ncbi:hypothetical protein ADUPG1_000630 [Aduncisulcus paluster]|uniref:Uncharacterized protein n=1 Tax=Aduncisulcus paluster TaxID=2918883 RepID=A0ABQ5K765_9EUKA|nr:hypothetical protein ADUPG1_000630 [Aduncisulcus paluster]
MASFAMTVLWVTTQGYIILHQVRDYCSSTIWEEIRAWQYVSRYDDMDFVSKVKSDCEKVFEIVRMYGRVGQVLEDTLLDYKSIISKEYPAIGNVWCCGIQYFLDGVSVSRNGKINVLAVKCSLINILRQFRVRFKWIWELSTVPVDHLDRILWKIRDEIVSLQKSIIIENISIIGYLSLITADTPQHTKILGLHLSSERCQICKAKGLALFENCGVEHRQSAEYKDCILSSPLLFFSPQYHMPHDLMHLEVLRLGGHMIKFLNFAVPSRSRKELRRVCLEKKIPNVFDRLVDDVRFWMEKTYGMTMEGDASDEQMITEIIHQLIIEEDEKKNQEEEEERIRIIQGGGEVEVPVLPFSGLSAHLITEARKWEVNALQTFIRRVKREFGMNVYKFSPEMGEKLEKRNPGGFLRTASLFPH